MLSVQVNARNSIEPQDIQNDRHSECSVLRHNLRYLCVGYEIFPFELCTFEVLVLWQWYRCNMTFCPQAFTLLRALSSGYGTLIVVMKPPHLSFAPPPIMCSLV